MAFCIKSKKEFNLAQGNEDIGPGSYENQIDKNYRKVNRYSQNKVPFNQADLRNIDKQQIATPGPGQYDLKFTENPLMNSTFASTTERSKPKEQLIPEAGDYQPFYEAKKIKIQKQEQLIKQIQLKQKQKLNLKKEGFIDQKIQFQDCILKKIEKQSQIVSSSKQKKINGHSWSQLTEKKFVNHFKEETSQKIGPGKYENDKDQKLFQKKSNSQFLSNTFRQSETKQGFYSHQFQLQKLKNEAIKLASCEKELSQINSIQIDKDQYISREYLNPGPGQYHTEKINEKQEIGWSRDSRFNHMRSYSTSGPFENQQTQFNQNYTTTQGKFLSSEKMIKNENSNPGPAEYKIQNTISQKSKKYKLQQEYKNRKRSSHVPIEIQDDNPGPGHYQNMDQIKKELEQISDKNTYQFISQTQKKHFIENKDQGDPGRYQQICNTIQNNMEDKKIGMKHVPYNKSVKEHKRYENIDEEISEKEKIIHTQQKFYAVQKDKQLPNEKRFLETYKSSTKQLGPGQYYDSKKQPLNKITYNSLFVQN